MTNDTVDTIWVADDLFLNRARFHRQTNVSFLMDRPAKALLNAWRMSIFVSDPNHQALLTEAGRIPDMPDVHLYHVRGKHLLDESVNLCEQSIAENDVFVIFRCDEDQVATFSAVVQQTRGFPDRIMDKLPASVAQVTLAELVERREKEMKLEPRTISVTQHFGSGASFTGSLAVGDTIVQTYNAASETKDLELREKLEDMVAQVSKLVESLESEDSKNEVGEQLSTFVAQAKKEKPSKQLLKVTAEGILEAAKTVAAMAAPVATAVKAVLDLLLPGRTGAV